MTAPEWTGPKTIGTYRVVGLIGVGASASVFRAVRPDDDFQVAIKVLADNHSAVPDTRQRFAEEQKLMASLDHPAIATVYETGRTDDGRPFTVMELADRGDLRNRVSRGVLTGRTATIGDIRSLADHLRDALTVLHTNDVVHRDISPANILIRADQAADRPPMTVRHSLLEPGERLLLADLGFAKQLADASGLTRGGGTKGFAAPEQRAAVSIVDHRADLYSATALVQWLAAESAAADRLTDFVAKGTAESPEERHDNIEQWHKELEAILDAGLDPAVVQTPTSPTWQNDNTGDRGPLAAITRMLAPVPVLAVAGLLAIVAVGLLLLQDADSDTGGGNPIALVIDRLQSEAVDQVTTTPNTSTTSNTLATSTTPSTDTTVEGAVSAAATDTVRQPGSSTTSTAASSPVSTATSSTASSQRSTTTQRVTTTQRATTTQRVTTTRQATTTRPPTSATSAPTTAGPTTTVNPHPFSPRAYFSSPAEGLAVGGSQLVMSGTATSPNGISWVELTIRNDETFQYWHDDTASMEAAFVRFQVPVTPAGGTEVTWTYQVDTATIPAGTYRLRVWGRATTGEGDPLSDIRTVTVN